MFERLKRLRSPRENMTPYDQIVVGALRSVVEEEGDLGFGVSTPIGAVLPLTHLVRIDQGSNRHLVNEDGSRMTSQAELTEMHPAMRHLMKEALGQDPEQLLAPKAN